MFETGDIVYYITYKYIRGFGNIPDGYKTDTVRQYDDECGVRLLDADIWRGYDEVCYTEEEIRERFKRAIKDIDIEGLRRTLQVYVEYNK